MTFDEMLAQVLALLQREKRVSYRALKVRFQLDDDLLEAVKDELIYAKKLAADEENRVLVWTGDTASGQAVAPQYTPTTQPPAAQEQPSSQVALLSPAPHAPPDAERRQLTVMFCDLVDSTKLSSQLDPEDWRDVVRAYQQVCTEVIQRFDGHVAQLLGDGLLVYFGYPHAHEDDAHRAVRTGLGILAAMGDLNKGLLQAKGIQLAVRVGIHTGLVVVGAMGEAGRQEQLALGETPNIAARIQGLAEPNTIAMSEATSRLVQGYFVCQDLGAQTLRGVAEPLHVYRVLQDSGARGRLDVAQPRGLTPLVGREQEIGLLLERWAQVKAGHGHVVLLSGEGGIGKSRLVQVFKDHVATESHVRWECRSVPYYQNTALYPLTDLFQRTLQWRQDETSAQKLRKLEQVLSQYTLPLEESVPLFAPLLSLSLPEHRYSSLNLSSQRQRQKTLETLVAILLELAEHQPVLFIVEDLHWTDPTTLELLNLVLDQTPTASLLVLLTCRPHFQPAWHHHSYITEMTLSHLSCAQVEQIVHAMTAGETFPAAVLQHIITKTDGVPLFVEEMMKAILESGQLTAADGHYALTGSFATFAIPATLQDSLMARLDRLVTAKAVAQYAAVIGRQVSYELLQAVSQLDEVTLQRELGRLVEAEIVYHRGVPPQATYTFKHALIQDAAYQSLLRSTRQQYHQRIAQVLEAQFPETAETQPEVMAHHYTEAGIGEQAVGYWQRAGQRAIQRSANVEAIAYLTQGLEGLKTLPETVTRARQELDIQVALAVPVMATTSLKAPEVERVYTRALALCRQVGEVAQLFSVLLGLYRLHTQRGDFQKTLALEQQLLDLVQRQGDAARLMELHRRIGIARFHRGEFHAARTHLEQGIALYDPQQHQSLVFVYGWNDAGVGGLGYYAWTLWVLGYPAQALKKGQEALTLAEELSHPLSLAFAHHFLSRVHLYRREGQLAQEHAEAGIVISTEYGLTSRKEIGMVLRGWALAEQGQGEEAVVQIQQALTALSSEMVRPYFLALFAEVYGKCGQTDKGLEVLAEASAIAQREGDYEAEMYRLRGELLLQHAVAQPEEAEACFQQALDIARRQEAKSLELRAAMSLVRLWQQQGKRQKAHDLLAPVYGWFTEGFDTADLQEAKSLLDTLA
jgi:class 3 adenylate cyclase/predicted ATPase